MNLLKRIHYIRAVRLSLGQEIKQTHDELRYVTHLISRLQDRTNHGLLSDRLTAGWHKTQRGETAQRQALTRDLLELAEAQSYQHDLHLRLSRFRSERRRVIWTTLLQPSEPTRL